MDNAAKQAIEALKATAPESPLPWRGLYDVFDANGFTVAWRVLEPDAAHIAAAVNAAPHLLARVAELEAALEAARVAVGKISIWDVDDHHCIEHVNPVTRGCERCDAVHGLAAARLALGLEMTK